MTKLHNNEQAITQNQGLLYTGYLGVFEQKLTKIKGLLKEELKKDKKDRRTETLKRLLSEAKDTRQIVKTMRDQTKDSGKYPLFIKQQFQGHSGKMLEYKIECDSLTSEDLKTLAFVINNQLEKEGKTFSRVVGIVRGGLLLSAELKQYVKEDGKYLLIVDDVLTTGNSMEEAKKRYKQQGNKDIIGIVIFARTQCPSWVKPVFQMSWIQE